MTMTALHNDNESSLHPGRNEEAYDNGMSQEDIDRITALYTGLETNFDELKRLFLDDPCGNRERYDLLLDDMTYEALDESVETIEASKEFIVNAASIRSNGLSPENRNRLQARQRAIFNDFRKAIVEEAGLPTEASLSEMDAAKHRIQVLIEQHVSESEQSNPADILRALGIIFDDNDGKARFGYPKGIFPASTDKKWRTYLTTVLDYFRTKRADEKGTGSKRDLETADGERHFAHNQITKDIHELLGLDRLPESEWDVSKTREMVAKMRDTRFPTVETAEEAVTHNAILSATMGHQAVHVLAKRRLSDLHT